MLAMYQRALARAPLRTNLATAVPMMVAGDLCAQRLEGGGGADPQRPEGGGVDLQRTTVMATYSGAIFTPIFFYLRARGARRFPVVRRRRPPQVPRAGPAAPWPAALARAAEGDLFDRRRRDPREYAVPRARDRRRDASLREATRGRGRDARIRRAAEVARGPAAHHGRLPLVLGPRAFRPAPPPPGRSRDVRRAQVNFCNFYWTPPQYRILVVSASAVAWNCYLSLVQHEVFVEAHPP